MMLIGQRLRRLRQAQKLSLGDIQQRVGLMRTYVSRVERGRTIPTIDTLEKLAFALRLPLYRLFVEPAQENGSNSRNHLAHRGAHAAKHLRDLRRFRRMMPRLSETDRDLLLATALQMARRYHA